jgi:ribosome-binding factor A
MGNRNVRVNELFRREISDILHTRFQTQSVKITVTGVDVTPDHREAKVYYSTLGDETDAKAAAELLHRIHGQIWSELGKRIVLKFIPKLFFMRDDSMERGARLISLLDELEHEEGKS